MVWLTGSISLLVGRSNLAPKDRSICTRQTVTVPHRFRSSFRDWAAERTNHPCEVIEAVLAHVVQNTVEAAYARSDMSERQRHLMNDWAAHLNAKSASTTPASPSFEMLTI